MATISSAPADSQEKQPPTPVAQNGEAFSDSVDHFIVNALSNLSSLGEIQLGMRHLVLPPRPLGKRKECLAYSQAPIKKCAAQMLAFSQGIAVSYHA
jgi:hypothetical protein